MRSPITTALPLLLGVALTTTAAAGTTTASAAAFGPPQKSCKKLKGKQRTSCQRNNQTTRLVFDAIKDHRFNGRMQSGATVDATFCASGKWKVDVVAAGTPQSFSGTRWRLTDVARRSPKSSWIRGLATGPSTNIFTRVPLQRRGATWVFVGSSWEAPGPAIERTSAKDTCAAL